MEHTITQRMLEYTVKNVHWISEYKSGKKKQYEASQNILTLIMGGKRPLKMPLFELQQEEHERRIASVSPMNPEHGLQS